MKKKGLLILLLILEIGWLIFIFLRSLKSGEASTWESMVVLRFIRRFFPDASLHFIRKLAHFTEFFILGTLLSLFFATLNALRNKRFRFFVNVASAAAFGLAAAFCDELLQLTSPGRSCQLSDVLLDFSGVLLACLIVSGIIFLMKLSRRSSGRSGPDDKL